MEKIFTPSKNEVKFIENYKRNEFSTIFDDKKTLSRPNIYNNNSSSDINYNQNITEHRYNNYNENNQNATPNTNNRNNNYTGVPTSASTYGIYYNN